MKDGYHVIDSDLHVIEMGDVYEKYLDDKYRDKMPKYLGWSPTNFPHWEVQGQLIPPWAKSQGERIPGCGTALVDAMISDIKDKCSGAIARRVSPTATPPASSPSSGSSPTRRKVRNG